MKEEVKNYDANREFFIEEECYINELSNSENDNEASIAKARVKPGVSTRWHKLQSITERYVIIEGEGTVEIGEIKQKVGPYDVVIIPPNCRQRITNNGKNDLIFLTICSPRFISNAYMDLENEESKA
ncbi:MAG: cupin domain-containing protein [Candidatus Nitrosoglobus sp.]|jgi:mannose-6-phosphate isomerase-like protein (cupin superfamily)